MLMNGAESLLKTLANAGIDICFTNPGTSEMQFVAAVDRVEGMRCILGLFEGVVTGAADGYARMTDKPGATLLHLGPGLANGLANFHNAKKACVPIVNIVGEHATYHRHLDPPLASDIAAFARPVSNWIKTVESAHEVPSATHAAIQASLEPPGHIATLILPADCAWQESAEPVTEPIVRPEAARVDDKSIESVAIALRSGEPAALLLSGSVLRGEGLTLAGKISAKTGARLYSNTFNARVERGAGRTPVFNLPYSLEKAIESLSDLKHLILVGSKPPVAFFAYPGLPNELTPEGVSTQTLATPDQNGLRALEQLVDALGANNERSELQELMPPKPAGGELDPQSIAQIVAALLPENAIVVDEAVSSSSPLQPMTAASPPHDWLSVTGGSIGIGFPLAIGAAVACPHRKVLCLEADGSGMYTLQALWTQVRESLNITTVIYANQAYNILRIEHQRVGAGAPGPQARDLMALDRPNLDWVKMAQGMGMLARRVTTTAAFNKTLDAFLKEPGPNLIEAII